MSRGKTGRGTKHPRARRAKAHWGSKVRRAILGMTCEITVLGAGGAAVWWVIHAEEGSRWLAMAGAANDALESVLPIVGIVAAIAVAATTIRLVMHGVTHGWGGRRRRRKTQAGREGEAGKR